MPPTEFIQPVRSRTHGDIRIDFQIYTQLFVLEGSQNATKKIWEDDFTYKQIHKVYPSNEKTMLELYGRQVLVEYTEQLVTKLPTAIYNKI